MQAQLQRGHVGEAMLSAFKSSPTCPVQLTVELWDGRPAEKDIQGSGCAGCCGNCELHADINSFRSIGFP